MEKIMNTPTAMKKFFPPGIFTKEFPEQNFMIPEKMQEKKS